ncbi:hypothetical protein LTR37_006936 [Vermiconidia calcicola]|uniref:Uncharacterized protein n=1 Tax=Vermiconidia calcicola TaxID=1690605 RepID=A0ACC3NEV5_9PEZI|nr:hypothetical protein LTR37_006936 [Vermiconidia calcicola]
MKCTKPNTDQDCTLTVYANGFPCPEFILPSQSNFTSTHSDIVECFIPVTANDELTIKGVFSGTILHGSFDVVADGSFLVDKRVEGQAAELKHHKRKLHIDKAFDMPQPPDHKSIFPSEKVVEGPLNVRALPANEGDDGDEAKGNVGGLGSGKLGLGSLAVIIDVNQKADEMHRHGYASMIGGSWRERDDQQGHDGGIKPTHELIVKVTEDEVHKNRQSKHKRHFDQTRFGKKTWAKFIFYYRSQMAIEKAGCQPRPDKIQELEDDAGDTFIRSTEVVQNGGNRKPKKVAVKKEENEEMGDNIQVSPSRLNRTDGFSALPPPQTQQKKKKLFGQALFREPSPDTLFVTPTPTKAKKTAKSERGSFLELSSPAFSGEDDDDTTMTVDFDRVTAQSENEQRAQGDGANKSPGSINGQSSSEDEGPLRNILARNATPSQAVAEPELIVNSSQIDGAGTRSADTTASADVVETITQSTTQARQLEAEPEDPMTSRASMSVPSLDELRALASDQGVFNVDDLAGYCEIHNIDYELGLQGVREIADESGALGMFFLKDVQGSEAQADAPTETYDGDFSLTTADIDGFLAEQAGAGDMDATAPNAAQQEPVKVKIEPIDRTTMAGNTATTPTATVDLEAGTAMQTTLNSNMEHIGKENTNNSHTGLAGKALPASSDAKAKQEDSANHRATARSPSTPQAPVTPIPASPKRAGTPASREGTPSKKPKLSELSARKAAAAAQLEETRQKRVAIERKKRLDEEEKKARKEEKRKREEALMRDIEELERQNAKEAAELEAQMRESEEAEADDSDEAEE